VLPLHFFTPPLFRLERVALLFEAALKRRGRRFKEGMKGSLWKTNI
ncbi:hypothetical protein HAL07_07740, partial [Helicobacter ailurogastricus]